jgi:hypothetical protein
MSCNCHQFHKFNYSTQSSHSRNISPSLPPSASRQAIASKPPAVGHSRQLVLITDGEVDNTSAVIRAARASSGDTRIFAFGIGREVSLIKIILVR